MKKIFSLLVIMSLFLVLGTVGFSDEEESKYRKDFTVNNSTKLEIPKSTSGEIKFNLKGNYIIEIIGDGSNIAMNDAISVFRGKKETKILHFKKSQRGKIIYQLKKGRYKIRISPNGDQIDSYIVGEAAEFNPTIDGDALVYEIDTKREKERFKQDYKANKNAKLKIELEKIE